MHITIDCDTIQDHASFHRAFSSRLHLPGFYGDNIDALFDCLTSLPEKTTIRLMHAESLIHNLGSYGRAAINAITRAERENPELLTVLMT